MLSIPRRLWISLLSGSYFRITTSGRNCTGNRKINLGTVFTGQTVGIREVADKIWLVSFMDYYPGFFNEDVGRVEPATNSFVPEL